MWTKTTAASSCCGTTCLAASKTKTTASPACTAPAARSTAGTRCGPTPRCTPRCWRDSWHARRWRDKLARVVQAAGLAIGRYGRAVRPDRPLTFRRVQRFAPPVAAAVQRFAALQFGALAGRRGCLSVVHRRLAPVAKRGLVRRACWRACGRWAR